MRSTLSLQIKHNTDKRAKGKREKRASLHFALSLPLTFSFGSFVLHIFSCVFLYFILLLFCSITSEAREQNEISHKIKEKVCCVNFKERNTRLFLPCFLSLKLTHHKIGKYEVSLFPLFQLIKNKGRMFYLIERGQKRNGITRLLPKA